MSTQIQLATMYMPDSDNAGEYVPVSVKTLSDSVVWRRTARDTFVKSNYGNKLEYIDSVGPSAAGIGKAQGWTLEIYEDNTVILRKKIDVMSTLTISSEDEIMSGDISLPISIVSDSEHIRCDNGTNVDTLKHCVISAYTNDSGGVFSSIHMELFKASMVGIVNSEEINVYQDTSMSEISTNTPQYVYCEIRGTISY